VTSRPTATATSTLTPTVTQTGTPTQTVTPAPGSILFSDGFEEGSFAAGGWTLAESGAGSAAQIVTSPVWSGNYAASFATSTQQNGQQAFA
jgi:hypothetical protein